MISSWLGGGIAPRRSPSYALPSSLAFVWILLKKLKYHFVVDFYCRQGPWFKDKKFFSALTFFVTVPNSIKMSHDILTCSFLPNY